MAASKQSGICHGSDDTEPDHWRFYMFWRNCFPPSWVCWRFIRCILHIVLAEVADNSGIAAKPPHNLSRWQRKSFCSKANHLDNKRTFPNSDCVSKKLHSCTTDLQKQIHVVREPQCCPNYILTNTIGKNCFIAYLQCHKCSYWTYQMKMNLKCSLFVFHTMFYCRNTVGLRYNP